MSISSSIKAKFILSLLLTIIAVAAEAQITMTGTVKNVKGENLVGAYITIDSTNIATLTDLDGKYTLNVPEKYEDYDVTISYAGYVPETIKAHSGSYNVALNSRETQEITTMYVTTQKRVQRLVDVPITQSLLDSSRLRQSAIYSIDEVAHTVPGFVISAPSVQYPVYSIRGVASDEPYSYGQSRISVFMDGISISRMQASFIDHYDMEQVVVSKGPQGTLYGRGAEIGAVEFIRNKPKDEFGVDVSMQYGNYNQRKVVGVLNTPAGKSFANRFAFQYNAYDGSIKNTTGGKLNGKNTIAVRNSSKFHFGSNTDLHIVADFQNDDGPGNSYQCKTQFNNHGEVITNNKSPYTEIGLTFGEDSIYFKRKTGGLLLQLDTEFGDNVKLSSITGIRAYDSQEAMDTDGTLTRIMDGTQSAQGTQISQELRAQLADHRQQTQRILRRVVLLRKNQTRVPILWQLPLHLPQCGGQRFEVKVQKSARPTHRRHPTNNYQLDQHGKGKIRGIQRPNGPIVRKTQQYDCRARQGTGGRAVQQMV